MSRSTVFLKDEIHVVASKSSRNTPV